MVSKWLISAIISLLFIALPHTGSTQLNLGNAKKEINKLYPDLNLDIYPQIFIIHFGFCTSTKYCGQNLIDFIVEKSSKPTLVVYDYEEKKYLDQLRQIESVNLILIPLDYMQKHGLFSVYNLWYRHKRKVKKLV